MQFRLSTLFVAVLICAAAIALWPIMPFAVFVAIWSSLASFGVHWTDRRTAKDCKSPWDRWLLNVGFGALWGVGAAFAMLVGAIAVSVIATGFSDPAELEEQYVTPGEAFALLAPICTIVGGICGCILGGIQGAVYFVQSAPATDAAAEPAKSEETDSQ